MRTSPADSRPDVFGRIQSVCQDQASDPVVRPDRPSARTRPTECRLSSTGDHALTVRRARSYDLGSRFDPTSDRLERGGQGVPDGIDPLRIRSAISARPLIATPKGRSVELPSPQFVRLIAESAQFQCVVLSYVRQLGVPSSMQPSYCWSWCCNVSSGVASAAMIAFLLAVD